MAMGFILAMASIIDFMFSILMGCMLVLLLIFNHGSDEISEDDADHENNAGVESNANPVNHVLSAPLPGSCMANALHQSC